MEEGKTIYITEMQCARYLFEESLAAVYNPYSNKNKEAKEGINNLLATSGRLMVNTENNRDYLVYYAQGISELIGNQYVICRVIGNDNKPFGSIYVKPLSVFVDKYV